MEKGTDIMATRELQELIRDFPAADYNGVLQKIDERTKELYAVYKKIGAEKFVTDFYSAIDKLLKEKFKGEVSCKKGCHLCCRQNVDISYSEGKVIAAFCEKHNIEIPKKYLEEQLKYGWREMAYQEVGWCTFLKSGECSIYAARPLACRKYFVVSPPEMCDVVKFPSDKYQVSKAVNGLAEIEISAFFAVVDKIGKAGRLPEVLLPYSK